MTGHLPAQKGKLCNSCGWIGSGSKIKGDFVLNGDVLLTSQSSTHLNYWWHRHILEQLGEGLNEDTDLLVPAITKDNLFQQLVHLLNRQKTPRCIRRVQVCKSVAFLFSSEQSHLHFKEAAVEQTICLFQLVQLLCCRRSIQIISGEFHRMIDHLLLLRFEPFGFNGGLIFLLLIMMGEIKNIHLSKYSSSQIVH